MREPGGANGNDEQPGVIEQPMLPPSPPAPAEAVDAGVIAPPQPRLSPPLLPPPPPAPELPLALTVPPQRRLSPLPLPQSHLPAPELAPADTVELLPPEEPPPIRPGLPRGLEPS